MIMCLLKKIKISHAGFRSFFLSGRHFFIVYEKQYLN